MNRARFALLAFGVVISTAMAAELWVRQGFSAWKLLAVLTGVIGGMVITLGYEVGIRKQSPAVRERFGDGPLVNAGVTMATVVLLTLIFFFIPHPTNGLAIFTVASITAIWMLGDWFRDRVEEGR